MNDANCSREDNSGDKFPIIFFSNGIADIAQSLPASSTNTLLGELATVKEQTHSILLRELQGLTYKKNIPEEMQQLLAGTKVLVTDAIYPAPVFVVGECSSTFDIGWKLNECFELPPFSAIIALSQTSGRGQMRRVWHSPEGNLYASFFLPDSAHFKDEAASVITSLLCSMSFSRLGIDMHMKWPNDLTLPLSSQTTVTGRAFGKVGGLLIEERDKRLLAGLGININHAPSSESMRADSALPGTTLPEEYSGKSGLGLWLPLVQQLIMSYSEFFKAASRHKLIEMAEKRLIWRGQNVVVRNMSFESYSSHEIKELQGTIEGLSELGGLVLLVRKGLNTVRHELFSGSVSPV